MPVSEKRPGIQDADAAVGGGGWLDRVNEFGERHAKIIITLSAVLIVVCVIIYVNVLHQRTLFDRLEKDLAAAAGSPTAEAGTTKLLELKKKYAGTRGEPRVLVVLGDHYVRHHQIDDALAVYEDFIQRFPDETAFRTSVERSAQVLRENKEYRDSKEQAALKTPLLDVHPYASSRVKGNPLRGTPVKEPHPIVAIRIKGRPEPIKIELFEDEAPNSVANFIQLVEEGYLAGLTFKKVDDDRLQVNPKKEGAKNFALDAEKTARPGDVGALLLVRRPDGAGNSGTEFQILLNSVDAPGDATVFGQVIPEDQGSIATARAVAPDKDEIDSARVERKRDHKYEAVRIPK